jgi:hypothetical protein
MSFRLFYFVPSLKQKHDMKKKWYVRESQVITHYWEYEVEAETEEKAKEMVRCGVVKEDDFWTSEDTAQIDDISEIHE